MRKGLYFSLDALLAVTLMASAFSMVLVSSDAPGGGSSVSYQQADTLAEDSQQLMTRSSLDRVLSGPQQQDIVNSTSLTADDLNSSVLETIGVLWASNETAAARDLIRRVIGPQISDQYEYQVRVIAVSTRPGQTALMRTPYPASSPATDRVKCRTAAFVSA